MNPKSVTTLLTLLVLSAPASAFACISMMGMVSYETFPLDFLWLGNALCALALLFFGGHFAARPWRQRAMVVSGLIFGAGVGLFASNTLTFDINFTAGAAFLCGVVLANFRVTRKWTEKAALVFIFTVAGLATTDAFSDASHFEQFGNPAPFFFDGGPPVGAVTF